VGDAIKKWLAGSEASGLAGLHFEFGAPLPMAICLLILLALGLIVARYYRIQLSAMPLPTRRLLVWLRTATIVLACFLLLDPMFVGTRYDPSQNYLLLLYDDSRSMTILDHDEKTRATLMLEALQAAADDFEGVLGRRYQLAHYRVGEGAQRIRSTRDLGFGQGESNLGQAVQTVLRDFQGINVSAVILFSDGIEQPGQTELATGGIPVITIGCGTPDQWYDLELQELTISRSQGDRRPVSAKVAFQATGLAGREILVEVLSGTRVIESKSKAIESAGEHHEVKLEFTPEGEGWLAYTARLRLPGPGSEGMAPERVLYNNAADFLVDNRVKKFEVLYFSGRPNWENKFVQGALREDEEIHLTSVLRISAAEKKFVYRGKKTSLSNPLFEGFFNQDEDQPRYDEAVFPRFGGDPGLAGRGFPEDPETLFRYNLIVLGDIEARFFSQEQLELVREYVRKRGGTLFLLGGPHSFTEGHYDETLLEGLLPVVLGQGNRDGDLSNQVAPFRAKPTVEGLLAGSFALDPNPTVNQQLWEDLPGLVGLNEFPFIRAGATTLARAEADEPRLDGSPLFAMQRYGEGKTAILATGATWQWHMATDVEDTRHGRFWRQMIRSLAMDVPDPVMLRNKQDRYVEDIPIDLQFLIRDKLFDEKPGLKTTLKVTGPSGAGFSPGVDESIRETGRYSASFTPETAGLYRISLTGADENGEEVGALDEALLVETDLREYRSARYDPDHLRAMAEATGGRFFELDELGQVADRIPFFKHDEAESVRLPFWHFPGFFLLLILLWTTEWYLRRRKGYA